MRPANPDGGEPLVGRASSDAEGWQECIGLTFTEAEQLLDWLEAHGVTRTEMSLEGPGVRVRWRV